MDNNIQIIKLNHHYRIIIDGPIDSNYFVGKKYNCFEIIIRNSNPDIDLSSINFEECRRIEIINTKFNFDQLDFINRVLALNELILIDVDSENLNLTNFINKLHINYLNNLIIDGLNDFDPDIMNSNGITNCINLEFRNCVFKPDSKLNITCLLKSLKLIKCRINDANLSMLHQAINLETLIIIDNYDIVGTLFDEKLFMNKFLIELRLIRCLGIMKLENLKFDSIRYLEIRSCGIINSIKNIKIIENEEIIIDSNPNLEIIDFIEISTSKLFQLRNCNFIKSLTNSHIGMFGGEFEIYNSGLQFIENLSIGEPEIIRFKNLISLNRIITFNYETNQYLNLENIGIYILDGIINFGQSKEIEIDNLFNLSIFDFSIINCQKLRISNCNILQVIKNITFTKDVEIHIFKCENLIMIHNIIIEYLNYLIIEQCKSLILISDHYCDHCNWMLLSELSKFVGFGKESVNIKKFNVIAVNNCPNLSLPSFSSDVDNKDVEHYNSGPIVGIIRKSFS